MRKTRIIIGLILGILLVSVFCLFLFQRKEVSRINKRLWELRQNVRQKQQEQSSLDTLLQEVDKKAEFLYKKVSKGEKEPLELIKQLAALAKQHRLKSVEFTVKERKKEEADIYGLPILIDLEAEYGELLAFLEAISALERLVSIEGIKVERREQILPRQKITLHLSALTLISEP